MAFLSPEQLAAFVQLHLPKCPFARPALVPNAGDPEQKRLVIYCTASGRLRETYHDSSSLCQYAGPYLDPQGAAHEAEACNVLSHRRAEFRARRRRG